MGRPAIQQLIRLVCLFFCAIAQACAVEQPGLVGTVIRVIDGDSLKVKLQSGPIIVRLFGVDTPERDQTGGKEARDALARRVNGSQVWLEVQEQDRYERMIAVVYLGDEDINGWLIDQGHAWAYRRYLKTPEYCLREHAARSAGRGLWDPGGQELYAPWEWRNTRPGQWDRLADYRTETAERCIAAIQGGDAAKSSVSNGVSGLSQPSPCLIKGNISHSGRIYHDPDSPSYTRTRIDENKGERWFCTQRDAEAAGWRAPK